MEMVAKVGAALQQLLGPIAERVAEQTSVIQRRREFSPMSLAATFVLGYLWKPQASVDQLSKMAVQVGVEVTPQAVDQRRTPQLVTFLEQLFRESLLIVVASSRSLAPLLERFPSVTVLDSTSITLPDSQQEHFAGCGSSYSTSQAAVKLQTELDLRSGGLSHVEMEPGKSPAGATVRQHARRGPGSLRIADLGYFNVPVFAEMVAAEEHFLSRLQFGTGVMLPDGTPVELLRWLEQQPRGTFIDCPILLGLKDRLPCRLIAWRVPPEQANRRRQKLRAEMKRKNGKEPSTERMAWCDWAILVTSAPPELLTPKEIAVLYRARWQIELLFKRWKSQGLVAALTGSTDLRTMISVWSRLIACVVQHWLLVATAWGNARISWDKAGAAIREFANRIAASLQNATDFPVLMNDLTKIIAKTCTRNTRKKPGTFELLNEPELLDFRLT
jgi:hypothetical protein